jgi:NAD(P)-dependent dehydrogenase (short-subunit alcohol dehydrogenase family)
MTSYIHKLQYALSSQKCHDITNSRGARWRHFSREYGRLLSVPFARIIVVPATTIPLTSIMPTATTNRTVIITGGGGFLGQCVASALLEQRREEIISKLILVDVAFPETLQPTLQQAVSSKVTKITGSIADKQFCNNLLLNSDITTADNHQLSIFHLGAVMSGDGERDFDLCMNVNLFGCINMLEAARNYYNNKKNNKNAVKFIFCSAGATIGSGAPTDYIGKQDTIRDSSRATPHTTYGMTKACCELLLADYSRREFGVDARGIRLPTIIVRAGSPNAATTSCFSSVIREPLAGVEANLPIARDVLHAVTGKRAAVDAMLMLHDIDKAVIDDTLGFDRTVFLPATALSLGDLQDALLKVVSPSSHSKLGTIRYEVDQRLSDVVGSFPTKIDASRAIALGIPVAPNAETLVREYIEDFPSAIAQGIEIVPTKYSTDTSSHSQPSAVSATILDAPQQQRKVAVITGAGSGIGRAVSIRLAENGWIVVLAGRRISTLEETVSLITEKNSKNAECCTCVPTDVSSPNDVDELFRIVEEKYGKVDLLFNNAGINCAFASVQDTPVADFERILQTNVMGPFLCARAAMKLMAKRGGGGRIINNGSLSAQVPRPDSVPYTTAKHAILGLTKCIALDGRAINVACGQIDFGNVVSELSTATNKAGRGALQPNGTYLQEPSMDMKDAVDTFMAMANLPLEANVLQCTVMATKMPFVGRG